MAAASVTGCIRDIEDILSQVDPGAGGAEA